MTRRRLVVFISALAALVCVLFWFRGCDRDYANFPPRATGPWVAFGDSLTAGYGASPGNTYPELLSQTLSIAIQNHGRTGDTTSDGLSRVEEVARLQPRVVLLCLGGNDSLRGDSPSRMFDNLSQIIDRFHAEGSFVVLIGIRSASLRDRHEARFSELAHAKRVFYVPDMLKGIAFRPVYMSDAIHPNDAGYGQIAERLAKMLKPLLPELAVPK